jgi:long-chain acyl-CoA synthetase
MGDADVWDRRLGFWWIAEDHPDHPAIADSPDGPRTYAELAGDANQLAHLWRASGAQPGDAVGVLADNGNTIVEVSLACHQTGLRCIPLNNQLTAHELQSIVAHSGAKLLVIAERFASVLGEWEQGATPIVYAIGAIDGVASLSDARTQHSRRPPADRRPGGLLAYTSGTTGTPKGVRKPLPTGDVDRAAHDAAVFARAFDFRPFDGPMLVSTGMFHGGAHGFYMAGLNVGHSLVIMPRFDPEQALRLIERHAIRTGYMVPTQFHRLLQLDPDVRASYDVSSLHSIVHAAAPCPLSVKQQMMAWWGPVIWETYGGLEAGVTVAKPHRWLEKPGTVGRPVRGTRVTIVDDDGNTLPAGQVGHVFIENSIGFSYHDDQEQTQSAFDARNGSRFTLGDLGYLDADGYLFICDRATDMIINGGVNVYPAEIEAVLLEHREVADVAVVGVPDPEWGETVVAVVQPRSPTVEHDQLRRELAALCDDRLAGYKRPRRWEFRERLPRTEAGKLSRRSIREQLKEPALSERPS